MLAAINLVSKFMKIVKKNGVIDRFIFKNKVIKIQKIN